MSDQKIPSSLSVVLHVIDILADLGIRYHLGGSFASAIHGVPRQTMDADLVVDLHPGTVVDLTQRLREKFYVDPDVAREAAVCHGSFNAIHLESGFKIDFFVKGTGEFDNVELERSVSTRISTHPSRSAMVKTAEDTILRKLQWFRSGGEVSERQWKDVLGVLATSGDNVDRGYLQRWASELGVSDLLDRALGEVEPF